MLPLFSFISPYYNIDIMLTWYIDLFMLYIFEIWNSNILLVWMKNSGQWQFKKLWTACKNYYQTLKLAFRSGINSCNYPYKVSQLLRNSAKLSEKFLKNSRHEWTFKIWYMCKIFKRILKFKTGVLENCFPKRERSI